MEYSAQEMAAALKKAHEAGDTAAAESLARALQAQQLQSDVGLRRPSLTPPQAVEPVSTVPETGTLADAAGQGVTFGFSDEIAGGLGAGVNSVANLFGKGTGESFGDAYSGIRDAARDNYAGYAHHNPKKALAAEIGGGLLTGGAGAARAGALKGTQSLGRLAGIGAGQGAVYGAGASNADLLGGDVTGLLKDSASGAVLGGATGAAVPALAGSVRGLLRGSNRALGGGNTGARQAAVDVLDQADIPLTAGQRGGSKALQQAETTASAVPLTGAPLEDVLNAQRTALNQRLMRMAGFLDDDVVDGTLTQQNVQNARTSLGNQYTELLRDVKINLGDDFVDTLAGVQERFTSQLTGSKGGKVNRIVDNLFDEATTGTLTGPKYQQLRSQLGELARTAGNKPRLRKLYTELKRSLDDAFTKSAPKKVGTAKIQLDKQFAQFKQLEEIYNKGIGEAVEGQIPLAQLNRLANSKGGTPEWRELARAAKAVLPDTTPNSGTTTRLLTGGGLVTLGAGTVGWPGLLTTGALARVGASAAANPQGIQQVAGRLAQRGGQAGTLAAAPLAGQLSQPELLPVAPGLLRR